MSNELDTILPFGKYKGKPIEVLATDPQYKEWLQAQPWFEKNYPAIYKTVVINQFAEPSETPEHNKLQAKFLDDDLLISIAKRIYPEG